MIKKAGAIPGTRFFQKGESFVSFRCFQYI